MTREPVRLTDIFTNAAAIADYTGAAEVEPSHLLEAIDHLAAGRAWQLSEESTPRSPLGRRGQRAGVPDDIRTLAQRWFERGGGDPLVELDDRELDELRMEIEAIRH
jgi:hypothetical protein